MGTIAILPLRSFVTRAHHHTGSNRICFAWRETGACQFGENCAFSHGKEAFTKYDAKEMMGSVLGDIRAAREKAQAEQLAREITAGLRCADCKQTMPCEHVKQVCIYIPPPSKLRHSTHPQNPSIHKHACHVQTYLCHHRQATNSTATSIRCEIVGAVRFLTARQGGQPSYVPFSLAPRCDSIIKAQRLLQEQEETMRACRANARKTDGGGGEGGGGERWSDSDGVRDDCNVGLPFPDELINGALVIAVSLYRPPTFTDDDVAVVINGREYVRSFVRACSAVVAPMAMMLVVQSCWCWCLCLCRGVTCTVRLL